MSIDHLTLDALAEQVTSMFGSYRCVKTAAAHLRQHPPSGRVLIYGAGTHSHALLTELNGQWPFNCIGFIDQRHQHLPEFAGRPVYGLEEALTLAADTILISFDRCEQLLVDRLIDTGFAPETIRPLYAHPNYQYPLEALLNTLVLPAGAAAGKTVLIRAGVPLWHPFLDQLTVSQHAVIAIDFDRPAATVCGSGMTTFGLGHAADLLGPLLRHLFPARVLLATDGGFSGLGVIVRQALPQARIAHCLDLPEENAPFSFCSDSPTLRELTRHCIPYLLDAELAIRRGFQQSSEASLSPHDEATRHHLWGQPNWHHQTKHTVFGPDLHEVSWPLTGVRVVVFSDCYRPDNRLTSLRSVCHTLLHPEISPLIIDDVEGQNPNVEERALPHHSLRAPVHRAPPSDTLLAIFDCGWLAVTPDAADWAQLSARMEQLSRNHVPMIVHSSWPALAMLVRTFQAGIVIDGDSPLDKAWMREVLNTPVSLRLGAMRLYRHVQQSNADCIAALTGFLTE